MQNKYYSVVTIDFNVFDAINMKKIYEICENDTKFIH